MAKRGRTPVVYTMERAKEVRRRVRQEGERVTAVCADMGMNYENFLRWCRRNKFKVHSQASRAKSKRLPRDPYPLGEKLDPLRKPRPGGRAAAIAEEWKKGELSPPEVAAKYGVSYAYVIRLRKLVGLNPPAGKGRNIKNPNHMRKGSVESAEKLARQKRVEKALAEGLTHGEIGLLEGCSRGTVSLIKKRIMAERQNSQ